MKSKILNLLLLISSFFGFLQWGAENGQKRFLFQAEGEILSKAMTDPMSVLHPFIVLPFLAQILLLITLFQKDPSKRMTYISIGGLGLLFLLMFVIGIISFNMAILGSTIPFLTLSVLTILHHRNKTT